MLPKLTVIMPAYNAGRTIERALKSIREQDYPQDLVEILVLDGGSTDNTRDIAEKYAAKVINNPEKLPESAKALAIRQCEGDYALYIDTDEYFIREDSLMARVDVFLQHPEVKVITATGKISLKEANGVTKYSNYVSDPFSFFMYKLNGNDREKELKRKYNYEKYTDYIIFSYEEGETLPLFDAAMNMFDMAYVRVLMEENGFDTNGENASDDTAFKNFASNIFENVVRKSMCSAMLEQDYIYHDPAESFSSFASKMRWRVYNNVFTPEGEGVGFASRSVAYKRLQQRRIWYILYSCLIIPVLVHSIVLVFIRHDVRMLMHFWFNELVMFWIGIYMICKIIGITPKRKTGYGKRATDRKG